MDDGFKWCKYGQKVVKNSFYLRFVWLLCVFIIIFFLFLSLVSNKYLIKIVLRYVQKLLQVYYIVVFGLEKGGMVQ